MRLSESVKYLIIKMDKEGMSSRAIGKKLGIGKSTVGDFLRKETYVAWWKRYEQKGETDEKVYNPSDVEVSISGEVLKGYAEDKPLEFAGHVFENLREYDPVFKIETVDEVAEGSTHFIIPDTQVKPGIDMSFCDWVGQYMADKQPDVIVHIGDHADMESLSSYDRGTKKAEGKRIHQDIDASIEGMSRLLRPIYELQQQQLKVHGKVLYKPKMVLTLGNHEERIMRHVNANPELAGFVSYDNLKYKEFGWEVIDFLVPYNIHGVNYVHYMANPMSGKPYGGMVLNILKQVGESFVMGHKQCLDIATRFLPASGKQQWGIVAGACYTHDEAYKGPQGNKHWRGVVMLHNVKEGNFNIMTTDLTYLESRYGT